MTIFFLSSRSQNAPFAELRRVGIQRSDCSEGRTQACRSLLSTWGAKAHGAYALPTLPHGFALVHIPTAHLIVSPPGHWCSVLVSPSHKLRHIPSILTPFPFPSLLQLHGSVTGAVLCVCMPMCNFAPSPVSFSSDQWDITSSCLRTGASSSPRRKQRREEMARPALA